MSVSDWLEEKSFLVPKNLGKLSVRSLIEHRSGLAPWKNFWINNLSNDLYGVNVSLKGALKKISNSHDKKKEGEAIYSDLGYILLGIVLKVKHEKELNVLLKELFSKIDRGGEDFVFYPQNEKLGTDNFVLTSHCKIRQRNLVGEVHDENSAALGGLTGHAGVFGSALGVSNAIKLIFTNKVGQSILYENSLNSPQKGKGDILFGWFKDCSNLHPKMTVLRHYGFTGTALWLIPEIKSYIVFLTNRVKSGRASSWISGLRTKVLEEVLEEVIRMRN